MANLFWLIPSTLFGQLTCTWDGSAWDTVPPVNWSEALTVVISSGEADLTGNYTGDIFTKTGNGILVLNGAITTTGNQTYTGKVKLSGNVTLSSLSNSNTSGRIMLDDSIMAFDYNLTLSASLPEGSISIKTIAGADTVNIDSYHSVTCSDIVNANVVSIHLFGNQNASIGSLSSEIDGGGNLVYTINPFKTNVRVLNTITRSGINSDGKANGNIVIENINTETLTLGLVTTNGNRDETDIASVIIISAGELRGNGNSIHIDAWSADLKANRNISNLNTNLKYLNATTEENGSILINNISPTLSLFSIIAREYGKMAGVTENNDIMVHDGNNYVSGTQNIRINSTGNITILGNISSPNEVVVTSADSGIYTIAGTGYAITSNLLTLTAGKGIGLEGGELSTITGKKINASASGGGVHLQENNRLTVGVITAAGSGNNVSLETRNGNAWFGYNDSKISATGGKVRITASEGNISVSPDNSLEIIEADTVILFTKLDLGNLTKKIKIRAKVLSTTTTGANTGTYVENSNALTGLEVTTAHGQVSVQSSTTGLLFDKNTNMLTLLNGSGTSLSFTNNAGDLIFGGLDLGSNTLLLKASGSITHASGQLAAGIATIEAGKNIGDVNNMLKTRVDSLDVISGQDGIHITQSGALTLTANAQGANSDINIVQAGANGDNLNLKSVISSQGKITLNSSGNILSDAAGNESILFARSAQFTAGGTIGNTTAPLITEISNSGQVTGFIADAHGDINIRNRGDLELTANTNGNGDLYFTNEGNLTLRQTDVGSGHNIKLEVTGILNDINTVHGNLNADKLEIKAGEIGTASEIIRINVKELIAESTHGAIYLHQTGSENIKVNSIKSLGPIYFETSHGIELGTIEAPGQGVVIKAPAGNILDARVSGETKANIKAYSLDISAIDLGTSNNPLELDVNILSSSATGNAHAENLSPLHVTAQSITGKGTGNKVSLTASGITVFDNNGGTTTLDPSGSLELIAKNGNIIFLNTEDGIRVTETGYILMEALGTTLPDGEGGLTGNIMVGNLSTGNGNITLRAANHIAINSLNAGTGNVTLQANNGYIVDLNGPANNITAENIILSSKSITGAQADNDLMKAISDVGDRNNYVNTLGLLSGEQQSIVSTYQNLANSYQSKYNTSTSDVNNKKNAFVNASSEYDVAYYGLYLAKAALNGAQIGFAIAEVPVGAAQAIPITGDGGSHAALAIAKLVVQVLITTVELSEVVQEQKSVKLADARQALSEARAVNNTNKELWETNSTLLKTYTTLNNDYTDRLSKAQYAYTASRQLEILTREVVDHQNGIGSAEQALGVTASGKVDAIAFGQSDIFLESGNTLPLGHLDAQGANSSVKITVHDGDLLLRDQATSGETIHLYVKNGNLRTEENGKLHTKDLAVLASGGIGTTGNPVKTRIERLAAATATGSVEFINDGLTALLIDEIELSAGNFSQTITGISTATGDIAVRASKNLILNKPIKDNAVSESDRRTVRLTATEGHITGADIPGHITARDLVAVAGYGIGNTTVPLRTDVAGVTAQVTVDGPVIMEEISGITLSDITTANGNIQINTGGDIEAVRVVSANDRPGNTVTLSNSSGNMTIHTVTAGRNHGNIFLSSAGQINNDADTLTRISGHNLEANANNGIGITGGERYRYLNTDIGDLEASTVTGDINILQTTDLNIHHVTTGNGNISIMNGNGSFHIRNLTAAGRNKLITLSVPDGAILPTADFISFTAENISLEAASHIGTTMKPLKTATDKIEAFSLNGDISVSNQKSNLTIGGITLNRRLTPQNGLEAVTGNIFVSARDSIIIDKNITASGNDATVTLASTSGLILAKTEDPAWNHITAGILDVTAASGIGSGEIALRTDIDKFRANITGKGPIFLHELDHLELSDINKMEGHIKANDGITIITPLKLSDTTLFTAPQVNFGNEVVCSGNYLTVRGEAVYHNNALWRSNAAMTGENDKMHATGDITIDNLHVHAVRYAGKTYDLLSTDGNITGEENVTCPGYTVSVIETDEGKKILRITSLYLCDTAVDRNGNRYPSVGIGTRCWMKSNLRATNSGDERPIENRVYRADIYPDTDQNLQIFGRLYNWHAVMDTVATFALSVQGICPDGWELPSKADFTELNTYSTEDLKSVDYWLYEEGNNSTGFTALPAGYYDYRLNRYNQLRGDTYFWVSDPGNDTNGNVAHISFGCSLIRFLDFPKNNAASVRCVKM